MLLSGSGSEEHEHDRGFCFSFLCSGVVESRYEVDRIQLDTFNQ
jgi:hypothetical protein